MRINKSPHVVIIIFSLILLGCSRTLLSPTQFSEEFAKALQKSVPDAKVEIVEPLELRITPRQNLHFTAHLDNAYTAYKRIPDEKIEIIEKYVAFSAAAANDTSPLDRLRIVPIVKNRNWLQARSGNNKQKVVYDDFNHELIVAYAEDRERNVRYLAPADLAQAGIARKDLPRLARDNLLHLLTRVQSFTDKGLRGVIAGGDYEPSLLLLDGFWTEENFPVDGEVVVAVPTRNVLLVTGSNDADGMKNLRDVAANKYKNGPFRLSDTLFVLRRGRFVGFDAPR